MWWVVGGIGVVVLLGVLAGRRARRDELPSVEVMQGIQETLLNLQKIALSNVQSPHPDGGAKESSLVALQQQTARVQERVRLIYSVDKEEEGYMHVVSMQPTKPAPEKYHFACLTTVWLALNQQIEKAGIDSKDVRYHFDKSNLGTLFLYMLLTAEQQDALLLHVAAAEGENPDSAPQSSLL